MTTSAKATTYLGAVASDQADYSRASELLNRAIDLSRSSGDLRMEIYALSMLGRVQLFLGDLNAAATTLDALHRTGRAGSLAGLSAMAASAARRGTADQAGHHRRRGVLPAGLCPRLPAGRSVLGGHLRPRPRPRRRCVGGQRHCVPDAGRCAFAVQPARRPVRLARRLHPRCPMHSRPPARPSGYRPLDCRAAITRVTNRNAGTHHSIAAARRGVGQHGRCGRSRTARRRHQRRPTGPRGQSAVGLAHTEQAPLVGKHH